MWCECKVQQLMLFMYTGMLEISILSNVYNTLSFNVECLAKISV